MIKRGLLSFILLALVISLIFIRELAGSHHELEAVHLPNSTTYTLRINAADFWKNEAYAFMFQNEDQDLALQLKEWAKKRNERKSQSVGIDFQGEVLVFGFRVQQESFTGISLEVSDEQLFLQHAKALFPFPIATGVKNGRGTVVFNSSKKASPSELKAALNSCLNGRERSFDSWKNTASTFELNYLDPSNKNINCSLIGTISNEELTLNGNFQYPGIWNQPHSVLQPKHFHISSGFVPTSLNTNLHNLLKSNGIDLPTITAMSMNYGGTLLDDEQLNYLNVGGFAIRPEMEMLLQFESEVKADSLRSKLPSAYLKSDTSNEGWEVVQIDAKTLYIGENSQHVKATPSTEILTIKGDMAKLFQLKSGSTGAQFAISFVQQTEPFRSIKLFAQATEKLTLNVTKSKKEGHFQVSGTIPMKQDKNAHLELLRMVINYLSL